MLIVDFDFYQTTYGGLADEETFDRLIARAAQICDYYCFGRISKYGNDLPSNTVYNVKLAECAVFEKVNAEETQLQEHGGKYLSSESIGDKSESYVAPSAQESITFNAQACHQAMKPYLMTTGLMYRGFERGIDDLSQDMG